jgi:NhaP-type Na+/H+ or K+/H+ antiporter
VDTWALATVAFLLLVFAAVSHRLERSLVTAAIFFTSAGLLAGPAFGLLDLELGSEPVKLLAEATLTLVLFSDASSVSLPALRREVGVPLRLLGIGLPLTIVAGTLVGVAVLPELTISEALVLGVMLACTDAALGKAVVTDGRIPSRIRQGLNVESGLNDGLALPVVLLLIAAAGPTAGTADASLSKIALELVGGLALGLLLPLAVALLVRLPLLGAEPKLQPLLPLATGVILYAACHLTHANPYLAAFSAGAVLASVSPQSKAAFESLGESLAELSKFAALLVFGALLTPSLFGDLPFGGYVAVVLAIVAVRPLSLLGSLAGTGIDRREKLTAAWFGPKGFASVVYGLLVLQSGIPQGKQAYTLIAVCIAFSIVAHSSTDVPIARLFDVEDLVGIPDDDEPAAEIPAPVADAGDTALPELT